jgi:hypothetical protein
VEVKSRWPDPEKAARRIAGHANAAREDQVLWVLGVDEKAGVVGVDPVDLASWWDQVQRQFDEVAPGVESLVVPVAEDSCVVGLLFQTDRPPYVVRNPTGAGGITYEVPWRVATGIRSARRHEVMSLLAPQRMHPNVEVLEASVHASTRLDPKFDIPSMEWSASVTLYVIPRGSEPIVLPRHRTCLQLRSPAWPDPLSCRVWSLGPIGRSPISALVGSPDTPSPTIQQSGSDVLITGPGSVLVEGVASSETFELPPAFVTLMVSMHPVPGESDLTVGEIHTRYGSLREGYHSWNL